MIHRENKSVEASLNIEWNHKQVEARRVNVRIIHTTTFTRSTARMNSRKRMNTNSPPPYKNKPFNVPVTKSSAKNRGAHLSAAEMRTVALAVGQLITESPCDEEGRIHLNPIVKQLSDALGTPCTLTNFSTHRKQMLEKLATFYSKDIQNIYESRRGRGETAGTWWVKILQDEVFGWSIWWLVRITHLHAFCITQSKRRVIPQLAVLCVCYFWDDFKIHANDVYHRYITNDVTVALEVLDNAFDDQAPQQQEFIPEALKLFIEDQKDERKVQAGIQREQMELQRLQMQEQFSIQRQQMNLQTRQMEGQFEIQRAQMEIQRQQIEDQKAERLQQMELQKQLQMKLFERAGFGAFSSTTPQHSREQPHPMSHQPQTQSAATVGVPHVPRPEYKSDQLHKAVREFLNDYITRDPPTGITAVDLQGAYVQYANERDLPIPQYLGKTNTFTKHINNVIKADEFKHKVSYSRGFLKGAAGWRLSL